MSSGNSARIAGLLGLGNQVTTNSSACNTGTEAVVDAFLRIREGRAERMLAGGSEGSSKYIWAGFDAMKVLERPHNDRPTEASRPMSATAGGFVPDRAQGCSCSRASRAQRRGGAHLRRGARRLHELRWSPHGRKHDRAEPERRAAVHSGRRRDGGDSPRSDRRHQRAPHSDVRRSPRGRELVGGARPSAGEDAPPPFDQVPDRPCARRCRRPRVRRVRT